MVLPNNVCSGSGAVSPREIPRIAIRFRTEPGSFDVSDDVSGPGPSGVDLHHVAFLEHVIAGHFLAIEDLSAPNATDLEALRYLLVNRASHVAHFRAPG